MISNEGPHNDACSAKNTDTHTHLGLVKLTLYYYRRFIFSVIIINRVKNMDVSDNIGLNAPLGHT